MNKSSLGIALAIAATLLPASVRAQQPAASADNEQVFFDYEVVQPVRVKSARAPLYPDRLRSAKVEGQVLVQFVVDEHGAAQMNTFKVLKSTDGELTESVKRAVSASSYFPAEAQGHKVRQLVQQPYKFSTRS